MKEILKVNHDERRGRDSNSRSTREPDLKSGAVPLGHRGFPFQSFNLCVFLRKCYLFNLPFLPFYQNNRNH